MADLVIDNTIEAIVMPNGEELELGKAPTLQSKSVSYTPTETAQSATVTPDTGYDGLDEVNVSVGAISNTYVGSGVPVLTASDIYTGGDEIGIYPSQYPAVITQGFTKLLPYARNTVTASVNSSTGLVTAQSVLSAEDGYSIEDMHVANLDTYTDTLQLPTQAATTITPTETSQTAVTAGKWTTGAVTVGAISSTYVGSGITRRSSTDLTASGATVSVPSGFYENNASKAVASGTEGTPTATKGTVSNHAISVTPSVTNSAGYISGGTHTGTAVSVSASELVSGTLSITSSGTKDVTNYASASVASGGATASATKGAVTNHSVTVTPSVTRTAGYVTAGTSNGTAVTVSASELVSGSETKTANGTYDVTNLAELVVAVPLQTIYTGTSAPSSSTGSNGDVYIQTA